MTERSEETRRIAWRYAPALAIEAGWENPDENGQDCTYCDGSGTAPLDGYPVTCLHCHGTGTAQPEGTTP